MTLSQAAVFDGNAGQITLRDVPIPRPRGTEALARVLGCTICGSDLHTFEGRRSVPVPTVLGHEIVGEIIELGESGPHLDSAGQELQVGDRITWAIVAHCGHCAMCRRGLPQKCLHAVKYGHEPLQPGRELLGGLATHCLLVEGTSIVRLPDDLPLATACPASCATATVAAALESAGELHDRSVCIFGAGMLGLTACAMAESLGAGKVVCIDPVTSRLDRAVSFGATHVATPLGLSEIASDTTGDLGFDVVLELSGSPAAFHAGWPLLRIGGTLVLVGAVFPGPPVPVALEQIVRRHVTIRGIHNYAPRHLVAAVDFLAAHHKRVPFAGLVSQWYSLTSVSDAFAGSASPDKIRIGVTPR